MANIFVKFDGIPGESLIEAHKDEIEVLSFSMGAMQPISSTPSSSGGATSASVRFSEISIAKFVDKSTPKLYKFCAAGNHINTITFSFHRAAKDGATVKYLEIVLTNTLIANISTSGSGGEDILVENLSLNFGAIQLTYVEQARKEGGEEGNLPFKIDLEALKIS
jgi:type VI secretion system secreted protein Hcp